MDNSKKIKPWMYVTVVIALVTGFISIFIGVVSYKNIQTGHRYAAERELQLINKLQQQRIESWRHMRFAEANVLSYDNTLGATINQWLIGGEFYSKELLEQYVQNRLDLLTEQLGYDSAYILDLNGKFLLASGETMPDTLPEPEKKALINSLDQAATTTTEIRNDSSIFAYPFFSMVVPIYSQDEPIAAIWLVMDVRKSLYPIIKRSPSANESSQSILLMPRGDDVLLLKSTLSPVDGQPLKIIPANRSVTPVEKSIHGMRGLYYGPDHLGVDVIIYTSSINKSPWLLLTKIDESEALNKSQQEIFIIAIPIIIGLAFISFTLFAAQYFVLQKTIMRKESLELAVLKDPLTDLANRRALDMALRNSWYQAQRYKSDLALLMIDVDNFKNYNDLYGHLTGDKCLIRISNLINSVAQRNTDLVARFGGEEFVVLLPNTGIQQALEIAQRLNKAVFDANIEYQNSGHDNRVTVSVGVAVLSPTENAKYTWEQATDMLIKSADESLYEAKAAGRNSVLAYGVKYS